MRKKIIIGNWKMNKDKKETENFLNEISKKKFETDKDTIYGIAVPSINIETFSLLKTNEMKISSQDISQFDSGAYTGEISSSMLKSFGVTYVVIGHSERRAYHFETNKTVNLKAVNAIKNGLVPIICVGETLDEYENKQSKEVVGKQIKESLKGLDLSKIVVAYEPVWAIGTGKTATFEYAQEICEFIHSITSKELLIQYGGSVNGSNIKDLLNQPDIDGALVGGASLEVDSFISLISK
ncbi:MAG: triose-phosphate isomerase [Mycoplasmataceae bacterium]|nr:triose-phosphate isomerase [Mycoplasmataceae bacterium]